MEISNISSNQKFKGFKCFVNFVEDLSDRERCFVNYLNDCTQRQTEVINGKKEVELTDKYIPAEELKNYNIINVYGDIYRDANNKNEIFLKLRILPTPEAREIIKRNALDEQAKAEIEKSPFVTEFVSQPIAVRSKNAYADIIRNLEEKSAFFKKYISGIAKWRTSTKNLLKPSDKPKYQWDKNLLESMIYSNRTEY